MAESSGPKLRWYQGLTRYHWLVLSIGVLAWMFDCMDQRLFVLSRAPAMKDLMGWAERETEIRPEIEKAVQEEVARAVAEGTVAAGAAQAETASRVATRLDDELRARADSFGDIATALMVLGWAVGGFFFGIYGDKLGRVKTLCIAIGVYSVFTGLSSLSVGIADFFIYRFIMGCGIGGAFATAATLIAETMPDHARATALGLFQALSAAGNIGGSAIARFVVTPDTSTTVLGLFEDGIAGWRVVFMIGVLPAILVVFIMRSIREPDAWHAARATASENLSRQLGDIKGLFRTRRWRRNTLVGVSLAVIGVIGLWGVGFYSPELIDQALKGDVSLTGEDRAHVKAMGTLLQDVGALLGMLAFTWVATHMGRKLAFGLAFSFCWVVVTGVFLLLTKTWHAYVMLPVMGFATLSVFGGYSIYFPELYPARMRSTGTGFCYNVGRVFTAGVIIMKIPIRQAFDSAGFSGEDSFRYVSIVLASVYLLGLVVLIWAPETKDKPLPTDDDPEE